MIWAIPCSVAVEPGDAFGYLVPSVGVLALFYALMFGIQIILQSENGYKMALWMKLIGPVFCIIMNNFKYG